MEIIGIRYKENEDPVLTSVQHLLQQLSVNKHSQLAVNNINNIRRRYFSTSTPLKTLDDVTDRRISGYSDGTPKTARTRRCYSLKDGHNSVTMGTDIFSPSNEVRSSKRKLAPNPPTRSLSEGKAKHVLASDLSQCDMKGWLMDEVRGQDVWVVIDDMLFCVFDSDEAEISRDVVMLPGCRIRPIIFKSAPTDLNSDLNEFGSSKTITGIDKFQFLIDDVSTKRKLLFGVETRVELDSWIAILMEAVSMDVTLSGSAERIANSSKDKSTLDIGQTGGYMPSPRISRRPEILNLGSPLLNNGQTSSLTDFRRRIKREEDPEHSPRTPLKATHSDDKNILKSIKSKGLSLNFKSFGSLDSLVKKQKRSRSADDSMIPERRSLDDTRHRIISEMDVVDYAKSPNGHSRFKVLETSGLSDGIGPVVRRQVSDIKDRFFNGTSYSGVPGVRLGELTSEKASGYLQYRVMMKWINIWCVIARNCFYGFKTQNDYEIPIVAVVLKQCMVNYDSNTSRQTKDLNVFKLSQSHCKDIYLSAENAKELRRWLQHLKQFCPIHADDDLSIANSSECTQSYDSAFSNVSVASSHDFNDKPIIFTSTNSSPQHDEVFTTEARLDVSSPEDWEAYQEQDTISELQDPFSRPPPSLSLSARKEKNHFLQILRSKLKLNVMRKKSLPDTIERELMSPIGHSVLVLDDSATTSPSKSSAADIRRTKSFSAQNLSRMSSDSESESTGSHTGIKIHKPMCVKTVAAKDITDSTLEGFLERRNYNGQWFRYWFILHSNCLYCYLSPDDSVTIDVLDINNFHITALVDRFRGKPYVILLSHEEFLPLHLSTETREELSTWIDYLNTESNQACLSPLDNYHIHGNNNVSANKVEYYKQKLLAEVLQQKHTIELDRARRHKKLSASSLDLQATHDGEDRIVQMTRLHQRRMSTQIKMDTLQKQLHANSATKKPAGLFKFGKKKTVPKIELNPFLVDQIKALSVTMDKLNKDLAERTGDSNTRSKLANSYNNSKSMDLLAEPEKDLVHRSNSLKSSMQKLAHKTFIKASWTKRGKSRNNHSNSSLDSDESHGSFHSESDFVDLTKPHERSSSGDRLGVPSEWSLSSDSSYSLSHQSSSEHSPRSPRGENPMTFDIAFAKMKALAQVDEGRISPIIVTNGNLKSSPRKEVDPAVLAEIEAFEEMAKDMMNRLTVTKT